MKIVCMLVSPGRRGREGERERERERGHLRAFSKGEFGERYEENSELGERRRRDGLMRK